MYSGRNRTAIGKSANEGGIARRDRSSPIIDRASRGYFLIIPWPPQRGSRKTDCCIALESHDQQQPHTVHPRLARMGKNPQPPAATLAPGPARSERHHVSSFSHTPRNFGKKNPISFLFSAPKLSGKNAGNHEPPSPGNFRNQNSATDGTRIKPSAAFGRNQIVSKPRINRMNDTTKKRPEH